MDFAKGQIVTVTRSLAGSTVVVDAVATDTVLFLDDVSDFNDAGGSVSIDGEVYEYAEDAVDREANSLTISTGLSGGMTAYEDFVAVYPEAPTHHAEVLLTDDSGVTVSARVPHWARDLLREGPRDPDLRESVDLLNMGVDWLLLDIEFRNGERDASTTPIIVTTDAGESVRIDGDGISTFTNDPVPIRTIPGTFAFVAVDDGFLYANDWVGTFGVRKFDLATGDEVVSGWPITPGNPPNRPLAVSGGFLYVIDGATSDIRKYNVNTGAEVVSGFPIVGTFFNGLAAAGGFVYAVDSSSDIRKYDATTGVEDTGGDFPLVGSFLTVAADGESVYARDTPTLDIRKFDAATGTENLSGFPIAGSFDHVAAFGGFVYAHDTASGDIRKFDSTTGVEVTTAGFPISESSLEAVAVDADFVCVDSALSAGIRVFNNAEGYQSTLTDSSEGTWAGHAVTVSDLTATGVTDLRGPADIDYLQVTTTKAARVAAQNIGHNSVTVIQPDTFTGSGTSGDTDFWDWDSTNHTFDILVSGVYDLTAFIILAANSTGLRIGQIRVNGTMLTEERPGPTATTWGVSLAASGVPLSAGDSVDFTAFHSAGAGVNLSCAGSWLNIKRAGALAA